MAGRSIVNQGLWLQAEATKGTEVTTAMKRYGGIKVMPGFNVQTQEFKGSGYKVNTTTQALSESGQHSVDMIQDFNAITPVAASVLSYDGATQPDDVNAATAYEHTFHLEADAADTYKTYTGIWGDSTQALKMLYFAFNSLGLNIQRGALSITTGAISREPTTGATIPSSGVVEVPSVPIPARGYCAYIDDAWADLGDTQVTAAYEFGLTIGDKRTMDTPINCSIDSFESLVENEDTEYSGTARFGFDTEALSLVTAYKNGTRKFIRLLATGPTIGGTVTYEFEVNMSVVIQSPGEIGTAPNSPVVTLPFNFLLMPDPTTSNTLTVRLVNTVATL